MSQAQGADHNGASEPPHDSYWSKLLSSNADACRPWQLPDLTNLRRPEEQSGRHTCSVASSYKTIHSAVGGSACPAHVVVQCAFGIVLNAYLDQDASLIGTAIEDGRPDRPIYPILAASGSRLSGREQGQEALAKVAAQWAQIEGPDNCPTLPASSIRQALQWPATQSIYPALFGICKDQRAADSIEGRAKNDEILLIGVTSAEGRIDRLQLSVAKHCFSSEQAQVFLRQITSTIDVLVGYLTGNEHSQSPYSDALMAFQDPLSLNEVGDANLRRNPSLWVSHHADSHPTWTAAEQVLPGGDLRNTRKWTFAELDRWSDVIAVQLHVRAQADKSSRTVIGLCMGRTLESFAAILAIFKAGFHYLPIAEDLPPERKRFLVQNANAALVITSDSFGDEFRSEEEGTTCKAVDVAELMDERASANDGKPTTSPEHQGGYVLYTSGSTGTPKGVSVSGANLDAFTEGYAAVLIHYSERSEALSKKGQGRYLNLASRAFDPHISQMFVAWRLGYAAVTGERPTLLEDLKETVNCLKITHMGLLPSLLEQSGLTPDQVPTLALLGVGGEKVTDFVIQHWGRKDVLDRQAPLSLNMYGPTETTIGCTHSVIHSTMPSHNIGYPIGKSSTLVLLRDSTELALRGQAGELCIAGSLVADGKYLGRRPDDQGGFVDLPLDILPKSFQEFVVDPSSRTIPIYRTGDMACMLSDGSISFLGRKDEQIKIRGQRLELGEVTNCVRTAAAKVKGESLNMQEAVTVYIKHPSLGSSRLFTVLAKGKNEAGRSTVIISPDEIDEHDKLDEITSQCKSTLPIFMVPTIVLVNQLLRLPSGKVDGKQTKQLLMNAPVEQLLPPQRVSKSKKANGASARKDLTEQEQLVVSAICATLRAQREQIGVEPQTSIFELGIDSLSVVGLTARMREEPLRLNLTVADVLQRETVQEIAAASSSTSTNGHHDGDESSSIYVDAKDFGQRTNASIEDKRQEFESIRPALPLQENLLTLSTIATKDADPSNIPYIERFVLQNSDGVEQTQRRWRRAFAEEPILRTVFRQTELEGAHIPVQIVLKASTLSFDRIVAPNVTPELRAELVTDAANVPPLRLHFSECANAVTQTTLYIHHSLYDGFTLPLLLRDVYLDGRTKDKDLVSEHDDAVIRHVFACQGARAVSFWQTYLDKYNPPRRGIRSRSLGSAETEQTLKFTTKWSGKGLEKLREQIVRQHKSTMPSIFQSCFGILLSRYSARTDVVFGNVVDGRGDFAHLEGSQQSRLPCVTTVPVRFNGASVKTFFDSLQGMKKSVAQTREWQQTPLQLISRQSVPQLEGRPLLESLFAFQYEQFSDNPASAGYSAQKDGDEKVDFPLVLSVLDRGTSLEATIAVSSTDVGHEQGRRLVNQLEALINMLIERQDAPLAQLGLAVDAAADSSDDDDEDDMIEERPLSSKEEQALEILSQVVQGLDKSAVQAHTSFYQVGLDSINAIRFALELRKHDGFQRQTAASVLAAGCLSKLCRDDSVKQVVSPSSTPALPSNTNGKLTHTNGSAKPQNLSDEQTAKSFFRPLSEDDVLEAWYFCTPLQAGMLTVSQDDPHSAYNQVHQLTLHESVDPERLRQAWLDVIMRNDVFRTTFHLADNRWLAVVHSRCPDSVALRLSDDDISTFPPAHLRITDRTASFYIHHALHDGESLLSIFDQVRTAYQSTSLPAKQVQPFYRMALEANRDEDQGVLYWKETLKHYRYTPIVRKDSARTEKKDDLVIAHANKLAKIDNHSKALSVVEACHRMGVTPHAVSLLACAKVIGASVLQNRDVCFGHVLSARGLSGNGNEAGASTVGPMFNTVARRVQFDDVLRTNMEAAAQVQRDLDMGRMHLWAPLAGVISQWRSAETANRSAPRLFDVLFVFHQETQKKVEEGQRLWTRADGEDAGNMVKSEYDVNISVISRMDKSIEVRAKLNPSVFGQTSGAEQFVQRIVDTMYGVLEDPHAMVCGSHVEFSKVPFGPDTSKAHGQVATEEEVLDQESVELAQMQLCKALEQTCTSTGEVTGKTNVFDLGIDSITALRLIRLIKLQSQGILSAHISVPTILEFQTVDAIARQAVRLSMASSSPISVDHRKSRLDDSETRKQVARLFSKRKDLDPSNIEAIVPTLAGQQMYLHLWLTSGLRFYEPAWNYVSLGQRLDEDRIKEAWLQLRHDFAILRSTFVTHPVAKDIVQVIFTDAYVRLHPAFEFVSCDDDELALSAVKNINALGNERFSDLFAPPCRLYVVSGSRTTYLTLQLHHALYDGMTVSRLLARLKANYVKSGTSSKPSSDEPVELVKKLVYGLGSSANDHEQWWKHCLRNAAPTLLFDNQKETGDTSLTFVKCPGFVKDIQALEERASKKNLQLRFVVILSFAKTLAKYLDDGKTSNPTFGLFSAARSSSSSSSSDLVSEAYPHVNLLPFSVDLSTSQAEQHSRIQKAFVERIAHEQSSSQQVTQWCNNGKPLFDCTLNMLWHSAVKEENGEAKGESGMNLEHIRLDEAAAHFVSPVAHPAVDANGQAATALGSQVDASYLSKARLFVDLKRDLEQDCLSLGLKVENASVSESFLSSFASSWASFLHEIVA